MDFPYPPLHLLPRTHFHYYGDCETRETANFLLHGGAAPHSIASRLVVDEESEESSPCQLEVVTSSKGFQ